MFIWKVAQKYVSIYLYNNTSLSPLATIWRKICAIINWVAIAKSKNYMVDNRLAKRAELVTPQGGGTFEAII